MTRLQYLTIFLTWLTIPEALTSEPTIFTINTKKWSHVLDDHFISITINPTDILQGRAFGLGMNSTMEILKGLSPAYIRLGSADTNKYAFRKSHFGNDVIKSEDEFIITESHWMILNEAAKSAGLDIIVCLNAGHRNGATNKWDTRNSLELISFSESQGYNLTFQLGYEVQKAEDLSGVQFGKDLNRLRTILNAFPRYQNSKLIGPDVKILHRKEDADFVNDVLIEAGPTLDAITWHPRWPQPSKMKVSDISEFGYEFPADYLDWDRIQLNKILQRSIFKNPVWIGEPKTESTGTFAEGLLWARRLVLAAKQGIEVVMKQPSLMDISHPKPEYWIALLHKRLLGKSVLDTRSMTNVTDMNIITHCTNPIYWSDKPDKPQDGAVTVYAVNMGGNEQRMQIKGTTGHSQYLYQFVLTSGSDPDSVFSQMTYLNGEPLMMTDEGMLPEIKPRIKKIDRSINLKLPPYSIGFWVLPEARVRICQIQPVTIPLINLDTLSPANVIKNTQKGLQSIRNINQFIVEKLTNPTNDIEENSSSVEEDDMNSIDSDERGTIKEKRHSKRHRRQVGMSDIAYELRKSMDDIRGILEPNKYRESILTPEHHAHLRAAQDKIDSLTSEISTAVRKSNQKEEFGKFLEQAGLKADFGEIMARERGIPIDDGQRRYEDNSNNNWGEPEENNFENSRNGRTRRDLHYDEPSSEELSFSKKLSAKSLEDKYRNMFSNQIEKGKRRFEEMKNKMLKEGEHVKAIVLPERIPLGISNDIQEEILIKEIEVLEKTEETMTELMKNHKKRQEAIEEMIREEINEIKEDRLMQLEEVRHQKELTEGKNKRKKTEETDMQKNMKRNIDMLEEMIKTLDQKKTNKRETKGEKTKKKVEEEEKEDEEEEEENDTEEKKEKVNVIRKFLLRKGERAKELNERRNKLRESYQRITKKNKKESSAEKDKEDVVEKANDEESKDNSEEKEESAETTPKPEEHVPLKKNDEKRRHDVLKQISGIVEKVGRKNKHDDISGEFEFDSQSKSGVKRNPRKADTDKEIERDTPKKSQNRKVGEDLKNKEENEARERKFPPKFFNKPQSKEFVDSLEVEEIESTVEPKTQVTDAPVEEQTESTTTVATTPISTVTPSPEKFERKKRDIENNDDDDINFSSEERIKQFKEMKQRKKSKNDIPLDADNFLKMAGSTVKVMFDEVIPEAYDQTKEKIKTLGITDYFKEFAKFLEQIKSLDKIFTIIGNFVNGESHDDENPNHQHVQVIHRRRRSIDDETQNMPKEERELIKEILETQTPEVIKEEQQPFPETSPEGSNNDSVRFMGPDQANSETNNEIEQETNTVAIERQSESTASPVENQQEVTGNPIENQQELTGNTIENQPEVPPEPKEIQPESETTTESPEETQIEESPEEEEDYYHITKTGRRIPIRRRNKPDREELLKNLRENKVSKYNRINPNEESPWVKTTKEFIQNAMSALQRQRELSEIMTRETLNDLVKREIARKVIGKREITDYDLAKNIVKRQLFPVYQIPEEPNRKREVPFQPPPAPTNLADLHPGVYVVPTKDTTNIRSEQVAPAPNVPAPKAGMPNVVTLNIYYDRKGQPTVGNEPPAAPVVPATGEPHQQYASYYPTYPAQPQSYPVQSVPHSPTYQAAQNYPQHPQNYQVQYQPPAHEPYPQRTYQQHQQPAYEQVYVQPAESYPKSESKWGEYKALSAPETNQLATDPNWNIQYESKKKSSDNYRPDKRRSIANPKFDPNILEPALPFWKYFSETYKTGKVEKSSEETTESNSEEKLFEENRKRQQSKKVETEPKPEDEPVRDQRSIRQSPKNKIPDHKLVKRSSPYYDEFFAYLPENQDLALSDVINSGLINDEIRYLRDLSQDGHDDEEYFLLNNMLYDEPIIRRRRNADDMLKTNTIEKSPIDNTGIQHEVLTKGKILKKLTDEDSSLEGPNIRNIFGKKPNNMNEDEKKEEKDAFTDFFNYAYEQMLNFMKTISDLF